MKVLHVAHSVAKSYGGPTQSLKAFAAAAELAGAEVSIAAPECADDDLADLHEVAQKVYQFPAFGRNAFSGSPAMMRWLRLNARNYDVAHVHGLFNPVSSFGARSCIAQGVPTVIRPFGTLSRYTFSHRRQALKKAWFAAIDRKNVREAAAVHFTSEAEKAEAARHELDLGERGRVVPPPFLPVARQDLVGRRENIVLFLSRLDPVKNIESLLAAWPLVAAERRDWKLVIGGSGSASYEADLKALAESSNAGNSISFAGFLTGDRKTDLLSRARLFVLPSQHENFGVAVLEAISAGIPVILTPQVQLAPFVQLHRLGLVTSSETSSLARAIIEGIDDAGLQDRAARLGDDLVQRSFGPNVIGKQLMALYGAAIDFASHDRKRPFSSKS